MHNSKIYFILLPQGDKSCRRHTQCSSTLCGYLLCTWSGRCCHLQPSTPHKRNTRDTRCTRVLSKLLCNTSGSRNYILSQQNDFNNRQWCSLPSGSKIEKQSIRLPLSRQFRLKTVQWSSMHISKKNQIHHAISGWSRMWRAVHACKRSCTNEDNIIRTKSTITSNTNKNW